MDLVIDAQVAKGFYLESVLGKGLEDLELTDFPSQIFARLGVDDICYIDKTNQIEQEWKNLLPREWFDGWFAQLLVEDKVQMIDALDCKELRDKIEKAGFPHKGRDVWYVKTANAIPASGNLPVIISEDLDFYHPDQKRADSKQRKKILMACKGPVVKVLKREGKIHVKCVSKYYEFVSA